MPRVLLGVFVYLFCAVQAVAGTLEILYFERPPYYQSVDGEAHGFLIDRTRHIMETAGLTAVYRSVPPLRILATLRKDRDASCSVGWFKTAAREQFSRFSLPIYRNLPLEVLTLRKMMERLANKRTLADIFADETLTIAVLKDFSYGEQVDGWLKRAHAQRFEVVGRQQQLPQLIARGRADYMLVAPEEADTLLQDAKVDPREFAAIEPADSPPGNLRYLICSRRVPVETIARLNQAIRTLGIAK